MALGLGPLPHPGMGLPSFGPIFGRHGALERLGEEEKGRRGEEGGAMTKHGFPIMGLFLCLGCFFFCCQNMKV